MLPGWAAGEPESCVPVVLPEVPEVPEAPEVPESCWLPVPEDPAPPLSGRAVGEGTAAGLFMSELLEPIFEPLELVPLWELGAELLSLRPMARAGETTMAPAKKAAMVLAMIFVFISSFLLVRLDAVCYRHYAGSDAIVRTPNAFQSQS